jgi:malonate decarboxylase alpha subunit
VEAAHDATALLEAVIPSGDRVYIEGGNQKRADLLAAAMAAVEKSTIRYLRMVQTRVVLPEHLDVFERVIAKRLDYSYSGPQADGIAKLLAGGRIESGGHYPLTGDVS